MLKTKLYRLKKNLVIDEGRKRFPYKCPSGYLTIGVGRNLDLNPLTEDEKFHITGNLFNTDADMLKYLNEKGLTEAQIDYLLESDILSAYKGLVSVIGRETVSKIGLVRMEVLISMIFNLGLENFKQFKRMISNVKNDNPDGVYEEIIDSKYYLNGSTNKRAERYALSYRENRWEHYYD